jgi:hypothetical protein
MLNDTPQRKGILIMRRMKWEHSLMAFVLVAAGVIAGANMQATKEARAEVRGTPEPPTFQSGGQQSVPILREISGTLRQIDSRLARLEMVAQKLQMAAARSAAAPPADVEETTETETTEGLR